MVQQKYMESIRRHIMQNEMTNKRTKTATERYAEAIQDLFSKYETIKHHIG